MWRKYLLAFAVMAAAAVVVGSVLASLPEDKGAGSILYVCNCGDHCACNTVSTKPGKCACGAELVPTHVLKIEGDQAILCTCGKDCTCKINPDDPTKCGCGKPVKKVSIKGMYVCGCSGGCSCNTVSDTPGKCKCGAEMKKI